MVVMDMGKRGSRCLSRHNKTPHLSILQGLRDEKSISFIDDQASHRQAPGGERVQEELFCLMLWREQGFYFLGLGRLV
jgi:hypothetical protein